MIGPVASARAFLSALAQKRIDGFAGGQGIERELIAEVRQRETEAFGESLRIGDRLRIVGKEAAHHALGLQVTLGVGLQ